MRARMRPGNPGPYLGARGGMAPPHPEYWEVPEHAGAAVSLLVQGGLAEYESETARGQSGRFAPAPPAAPDAPVPRPVPRPFARKNGK